MENRRFVLLAFFGVLLFFIYQAWQTDYGKPATPVAAAPATATAGTAVAGSADVPTLPAVAAGIDAGSATPTASEGARIRFVTDRVVGEIALRGADLRRLELLDYGVSKDSKTHVALLNDRDGHHFLIQSGIAAADKALGSHVDSFASAQTEYRLADGSDVLEIPLESVDAAGNKVVKTYRFFRGRYDFELQQTVQPAGDKPLSVSPYVRIARTDVPVVEEPRFIHTFTGVGVYEAKVDSDKYRFNKLAFKKLQEEPYSVEQKGGWISVLQHYFVAAILPPNDEVHRFEGKPAKDQGYLAQYLGASATVAPGTEQRFTTRLYVGPNLQDTIGQVAPGLELTVDYGFLKAISEPLFWLLKKFHEYTGNWGVAIILLTLLVKAAFYKLSEAQYRSTAKMRKFAPRIADLRERYADDRERMSRAMMELYKKEGFNPLAGCWPLLVQMPVFFALYWVFLESVELRQASFALWINDLTSPDPFYVLPVIYGVTMFVMQKLSGQTLTMDPMQQKIMNVMPIAMTGFFAFFPSGLVLYWCVSNIISIAQQWYITRKLEREELNAKATA